MTGHRRRENVIDKGASHATYRLRLAACLIVSLFFVNKSSLRLRAFLDARLTGVRLLIIPPPKTKRVRGGG